jgi:hypothetical protein
VGVFKTYNLPYPEGEDSSGNADREKTLHGRASQSETLHACTCTHERCMAGACGGLGVGVSGGEYRVQVRHSLSGTHRVKLEAWKATAEAEDVLQALVSDVVATHVQLFHPDVPSDQCVRLAHTKYM